MMLRIFFTSLLTSGVSTASAVAQALTASTMVAQLPSALAQTVPACAQECVQAIVTQNSQLEACRGDDLACFCSQYDDDGYTIGERAFACLYAASCSPDDRSLGSQVYHVCSDSRGAASPTHKVIVVTATSQSQSVSPTPSAPSTSSPVATTLVTSARTSTKFSPTSTSSPSPTALPVAQIPVAEPLSDAQVAGIVVASIAIVALIAAMSGFAWFRKLRRRLSKEHRPGIVHTQQSDDSRRRVDLESTGNRIDPRGGNGGVGISPQPRPRPRLPLVPERDPEHMGASAVSTRPRYTAVDMTIGVATTANVPIPAEIQSSPRSPSHRNNGRWAASPNLNQHPSRSISPWASKALPKAPVAAHTPAGSSKLQSQRYRSSSDYPISTTRLERNTDGNVPDCIYTPQSCGELQPVPRLPSSGNEVVFPPPNSGADRQVHPALRGEKTLEEERLIEEPYSAAVAPTVAKLICAARDSSSFNRRGHSEQTVPRLQRPSIETLQRQRTAPAPRLTDAHEARALKVAQQTTGSGTSSAIASSDVLPAAALRPTSSVRAHPTPTQSASDMRASILSCTTFETSSCEDVSSDDEGESDDDGDRLEAASPISDIRYPHIPRLSSNMTPARSEQREAPYIAVENPFANEASPQRAASGSRRRQTASSPRTPEYKPYRPGARDTTRYLPGSANTRQATPGLASPSSQYSHKTDTTACSECPFYYDGADGDGVVYRMPQLTPSRKGDEMFLSVT